MHLPRRAAILAALVALIVALGLAPAARAQEPDRIAKGLAESRERYEIRMQAVRDKVEAALKKAGDAASRSKDDPAGKAAAVQEQRKAFEATGAWPDAPEKSPLREEVDKARQEDAKAAADMEKAYAKAITDYGNAKKPELAEAVKGESERFKAHSDVVPWGENLLPKGSAAGGGSGGAGATLADGGSISADAPVMAGAYRIEVKARRSGAAGTLRVAVPIGGGKRLEVPARADDKGVVRLLLSVHESVVNADLGADRPIDAAAAKDDGRKGVSLRAEGGMFTIESVRVKPLVSGDRDDVAVRPGKPVRRDEPGQTANPNDKLVAGLVLVGERQRQGKGNEPEPAARIESRTGNTIVLVTERANGKGNFLRTIELGPGGRLTPSGMKNRGGDEGSFFVKGGSGTFDGTTFRLTTVGTWNGGGTTNNKFEDTLVLRPK